MLGLLTRFPLPGDVLAWCGAITAGAGVLALMAGAARRIFAMERAFKEVVPEIKDRLEVHERLDEARFDALHDTLQELKADMKVVRNDVGWIKKNGAAR